MQINFYHATDTKILGDIQGDSPDDYDYDDFPFSDEDEVIYIGDSPRGVSCYGENIYEIKVTYPEDVYQVTNGEYLVEVSNIETIMLLEEKGRPSIKTTHGYKTH